MKTSPAPVIVVEEEEPVVDAMKVTLAPLAKTEKKRNLKEVVGGAGAFFKDSGQEITLAMDTTTPSRSRKTDEVSSSTKRVKRENLNVPTPVAVAADQCLEGLKIAVTGIMEITGREELESKILELGGKVASAISGKTDMLIAGAVLEDGRTAKESSKYKTAKEKGVRVLSEEEFLKFVEERRRSAQKATSSKPSSTNQLEVKREPAKSFSSTLPKPTREATIPKATSEVDRDSMLWVDKYRPDNLTDIIGSADIVRKLRDWLRDWEVVHIKKALKVNFVKENPGAKAVLLSGPPGKLTSTLSHF